MVDRSVHFASSLYLLQTTDHHLKRQQLPHFVHYIKRRVKHKVPEKQHNKKLQTKELVMISCKYKNIFPQLVDLRMTIS